jgi:hypothetical protein
MNIGALVQMLDANDVLRQGIVIDTATMRAAAPGLPTTALVAWVGHATAIARQDELTVIQRPLPHNYASLMHFAQEQLEHAIQREHATAVHMWSTRCEELRALQQTHEAIKKDN